MIAESNFIMRIRGSRAACEEFASQISTTEEDCVIYNKQGSDDDLMCETDGWCEGTFEESNSYELADIAADLNIECEVFAYDPSEPEWIEHFHFKDGKYIVHDSLELELFIDPGMEPDEIAEEYENIEKYQPSDEDENVYVLKDEFRLWDYDEDAGEFTFHFTMSFDEL